MHVTMTLLQQWMMVLVSMLRVTRVVQTHVLIIMILLQMETMGRCWSATQSVHGLRHGPRAVGVGGDAIVTLSDRCLQVALGFKEKF